MLFLSVMLNFSLMSLSFSFEMSHAVPECDVELLPDEFVLQL